jgi:hypothetical protein
MLTKETDYLWARPSPVAHKMRGMELQAGKPQKKGNVLAFMSFPSSLRAKLHSTDEIDTDEIERGFQKPGACKLRSQRPTRSYFGVFYSDDYGCGPSQRY